MKSNRARVLLCAWLACILVPTAPAETYTIGRAALEDKVLGGWVGQMIGVAYGEPTEFRFCQEIVEGEIAWQPEMVVRSFDQDDLYVEMTFAAVLDAHGLEATPAQFGEAFAASKYALWHANAAARRNLVNGIAAPESGHPRHNIHANDIDFQIEADFIGLMAPGMPQAAIDLCNRAGRVMNWGDGLYGGMFVSGMYAAAFFEDDVEAIVRAGMACMPEGSTYYQTIADTLAAYEAHPDDWKVCWRAVNERWDKHESCPEGAFAPFNIDARLNGAYIAIGLLYGGGDFGKTLEISTRCGQDSDCNPSNAAGILGVMHGFEALDATWTSAVSGNADTYFTHTEYTLNGIVDSTVARAEEAVKKYGGTVEGGTLTIPRQKPTPPALEQWSMGIPKALLKPNDEAWTWRGAWAGEDGQPRKDEQVSTAAGDEAELRFEGTAISIVGFLEEEHGALVAIYLDGEEAGRVNAYVPPNTTEISLWHTYGLEPGPHTLRLVTLEETDPRAKGRIVRINHAQVFSE